MREIHAALGRLFVASLVGVAGTATALGQQPAEPVLPGDPVRVTITDADGNERTLETGQFPFGAIAAAVRGGGNGSNGGGTLPKFEDVSDGFEQVISTTDGRSLYNVWVNKRTQQVLAELPRGFERQRHFIATTVSGGEIFAGLQAADFYVYWKRFDDRLALIQPQVNVRSTGGPESRSSVERLFTDRVLVDVPIVATGPNGQPVIDLDGLLLGRADTFFGGRARGLRTQLAEVSTAKAFPENIEVAFSAPDATGTIKTFHYSISLIEGTPGFKPRAADSRIGYFTTSYRDLGKVDRDDVATRYINRWHLEKADPNLKLSPPKEPIVYYVEHTVPVRYRRWVRAGVDYWNEAYRRIGIDGAIEVRFQDQSTGAHMEKDPEDVRYNFIRWLNNDVSTAIGPSRVNPMTGEILDADVILTDGWLRVFNQRWDELLPELALDGMSAETLEWLESRPQWDPRVRLASPESRAEALAERRRERGVQRFGGHPAAAVDTAVLGDDEFDGLVGRTSEINGACMAARGKAMNLALGRMHLEMLGAMAPMLFAASDPADIPPELLEELKKRAKDNPEMLEFMPPEVRKQIEAAMASADADEHEGEHDEKIAEKGETSSKGDPSWAGDIIDGIPEEFVGPMLAELVAHEVGHTIGLRHNFKASSVYTLAEINSDAMKGVKPWSSSVMDYNGINIRMPLEDGASGEVQGDFSSIAVGPYDLWAIEYGYSTERDFAKVLERVAEPELAYGTDEDRSGPDPRVRTYDLSKHPIDWARNQMELVRYLRESLLDSFVKDGETWARARLGYQIALGEHLRAVGTMANWVGGAYVHNDKKGDPNGREPIEPVPADTQREALEFVIENTFDDGAFGLTPELLRHLTVEKWGLGSVGGSRFSDNTLPVHDQVLGVQSSAMTMILNPTTLRRVHDNTFLVEEGEDVLTLGEVMGRVRDAVWSELDGYNGSGTLEISSLRQNLQREHVERLIDLLVPGSNGNAAAKPVAALAGMHLRDLHAELEDRLEGRGRVDDEVRAHLTQLHTKIGVALDPTFIYNAEDISAGGGQTVIRFGRGGFDAR